MRMSIKWIIVIIALILIYINNCSSVKKVHIAPTLIKGKVVRQECMTSAPRENGNIRVKCGRQ